MTIEELLRDFNSLPLEAQHEIEDLVCLLRERYGKSPSNGEATLDLKTEAFVGMWRDRDDMSESSAWIRSIRETHWSK